MADPTTDPAQASDETHRRRGSLSARPPATRQRTVPLPNNPGAEQAVALSEEADVIETREAFLAAISHELRSPIVALKSSAQLLARQLGAPEEQTINRAREL